MLNSVEYDGVQIEVCAGCEGEWLHAGELQKIVEHHEEVFTPEEIASLDAVNKEIFTAEKCDHDELNCPHCESVPMEHFNYGDTSGIILHKCPECGGIWTDKDQLKELEMLVDGQGQRPTPIQQVVAAEVTRRLILLESAPGRAGTPPSCIENSRDLVED